MRVLFPCALVALAACGGGAPSTSSGSTSGSSGATSTGSSSGSSSSGSSGSTSGSTGSAPLTDTFDPDRVYVVGTFDEQYCGSDAIFAVDDASQVLLGLPCFDTAFRMRPDGKLLYISTDANGLNTVREFASDALDGDADAGWRYPSSPLANDEVIPTPACDAAGGPTSYVIDPADGGVVFNCTAGNWYDGAGTLRVSSANLRALGPSGHALVSRSSVLEVLDASGVSTTVAGLPAPFAVDALRARPDGWWLAGEASSGRSLWLVALSGSASPVGTYPDFSTTGSEAALGTAGDLTLFGTDTSDSASDTLVLLPLGGVAPVVLFTEVGLPPSDWSRTPPALHPRLGPQGTRLFSGP